MRVPRDISADLLIKRLEGFGYKVTRQKGSHVRMSRAGESEHHVTIPRHNPLRVGTLRGIVKDVAEHANMSPDTVLEELFDK